MVTYLTVFGEVNPSPNFPEIEEKILDFWKREKIFEKTQELRSKEEKNFIFLEGPPTANGLPHPGHVLTRCVKDIVLRFWCMRGYNVARKAGWDCHGLPVELEIEKELGISGKPEIEKYGIEKFNNLCRESVFRYEKEWVKMTERIGFWIDMDHPYITLEDDYMESIWWSLKELWDNKLLYKDRYVVPYCPRCGTPLSSHEVSLGYSETEDPSIYIKFKVKDKDPRFEDAYFLAWTTTPWTLLSNMGLAVHPEFSYSLVEDYFEEKYILATELVEKVVTDSYTILDTFKGEQLENMEYEPLFPFIILEKRAHFVVTADFVTLEEGTGIVHMAPAFGAEDFETGKIWDLPFAQPVDEEGKFTDEIPPLKGLFVKEADPKIIKMLKDQGSLYREETYTHTYPFCWRCETPLLYYARDTWFIAMKKVRENLLNNNEKIDWYPSYLKHGRFGEFLENVVDWALSRERYWGTPLPIWICESCGHTQCFGSREEVKKMAIKLPEHFELHRPYVDEIVLKCPECGSSMYREPFVIDCWYDSGAAPFAQWHYPFENEEIFKQQFPATFITEAIDQTRGWFYSLIAASTATFNKESYQSCLSLGHILDEVGVKMSKSRGNVVDPWLIFNNYGADAMRWYFFSVNAPWSSVRFGERAVQDALRRFIHTLWNVYSFFVTYATIDKFNPKEMQISYEKRSDLDKWILSKLNILIKTETEHLDKFNLHHAARELDQFLLEDLSNWYVRRSRRRFWKPQFDEDKLSAYTTLYETLVSLVKLLAPFIPFTTEEIYQNIVRSIFKDEPESIHMTYFPEYSEQFVDEELEDAMDLVRKVTESSRSMRSSAGIKVRQPLSELIIICPEEKKQKLERLSSQITDEINVKNLKFTRDNREYADNIINLNLQALGPKLKDKIPKLLSEVEKLDHNQLAIELQQQGVLQLEVEGKTIRLYPDEVDVKTMPKSGYAADETSEMEIYLALEITKDLAEEGIVRDIVRRIQSMRKDLNLDYTQKITVYYEGDDFVKESVSKFDDYIKQETLAIDLMNEEREAAISETWKINGRTVFLSLEPHD